MTYENVLTSAVAGAAILAGLVAWCTYRWTLAKFRTTEDREDGESTANFIHLSKQIEEVRSDMKRGFHAVEVVRNEQQTMRGEINNLNQFKADAVLQRTELMVWRAALDKFCAEQSSDMRHATKTLDLIAAKLDVFPR